MTSVTEDLPSAVAAEINGSLKGMPASDAITLFTGFLSAVAKDCIGSGAVMVGHIKANVRSGDGMLSLSSTNDRGDVRVRMAFSWAHSRADSGSETT
jgi:hypothetical protein